MAPDVGIVHGELLLALTPPDAPAADAEFERAAELAGGSRGPDGPAAGAHPPRRPAARDAGRGRRRRTRSQEVYDRFTEGFDSPHLVAARAALAR